MNTKSLLAAAIALAFALSGCGQQAGTEEASGGSVAASDASVTPEATTTTKEPNLPSGSAKPFNADVASVPAEKQAAMQFIASAYAHSIVSNTYALSGKWAENGEKPVDIAAVFSEYFSDDLQAKLKAADSSDEIVDYAQWAMIALGTESANGEPIASQNCIDAQKSNAPLGQWCEVFNDGMTASGMYTDTVAFPEENRITFDYKALVPIRIAEDKAEGYLDATMAFDLTFVENPNEGSELPYLIDSMNTTFKDQVQRYLSDNPSISTGSTPRRL